MDFVTRARSVFRGGIRGEAPAARDQAGLKSASVGAAAAAAPHGALHLNEDLPWVAKSAHEKKHEEEFKEAILNIAKDPDGFLVTPCNDSLLIDMRQAMNSAIAVLEVDGELRRVREEYVPDVMREQEFWRRYFIRVKRVKEDILTRHAGSSTPSPSPSSGTPESSTRSSSSTSSSLSSKESNLSEAQSKTPPRSKQPMRGAPHYPPVPVTSSVIIRRLGQAVGVVRPYGTIEEVAGSRPDDASSAAPGSSAAAGWGEMGDALDAFDAEFGSLNPFFAAEVDARRASSVAEFSALLWSLFDSGDDMLYSVQGTPGSVAGSAAGDDGTSVASGASPASSTAATSGASGAAAAARQSLVQEIHGAPPDSFVAHLAEIMAGMSTEQKMAGLWRAVVEEIRQRWSRSQAISRVPLDSDPDLCTCLLHQQLQLINCCIARRKRRARALRAIEALESSGEEEWMEGREAKEPATEADRGTEGGAVRVAAELAEAGRAEGGGVGGDGVGGGEAGQGGHGTESCGQGGRHALSSSQQKQPLGSSPCGAAIGESSPSLSSLSLGPPAMPASAIEDVTASWRLRQTGVASSSLFARLPDGSLARRIGVSHPVPGLLLLDTKEQLFAPINQEGPVMTEVSLRESEELIMRTGSAGVGCHQLLSDMQAFKAANPGCILEDFVRWYSPPDWSDRPTTPRGPAAGVAAAATGAAATGEATAAATGAAATGATGAAAVAESDSEVDAQGRGGSSGEVGVVEGERGCEKRDEAVEGGGEVMGEERRKEHRGHLSIRMMAEGNLWQELWSAARPLPAAKQPPLFDEELAGESALAALENIAPSDLFEQLFIAAVSAGFAAAQSSPEARREPFKFHLSECAAYVVATCTRGMSAAKIERLCQVYEVMESALLNANNKSVGGNFAGRSGVYVDQEKEFEDKAQTKIMRR